MLFQVPDLPPAFLDVIREIDADREELRFHLQQQPRRWTGLLRRSTFARAIQGSNSIEGFNVTVDDAVAAVDQEEPIDEKSEAWVAVNGYRAAMSYVLQLADDPFYIHNEGTLRSLHYMMTGYDLTKNPGRWRPGLIFVKHEPTGETVYEGPDVELVPGLMAELVVSLNATQNTSPLVRAALAHLNLVMIHPFSDGNGRMARAMQTFVLARAHILDPHFSSIEEYLGQNTDDYYRVLSEVGRGAWHPENDALPWLKFCLTAHYRQAETLRRRTKEMERLWNYLEDFLRQRGLNERYMVALADAALGYRIRNSSYRKLVEVTEQTAGRDLLKLSETGLLESRGEKRARHYVAGEELKQAWKRMQQIRTITDPFSGTHVTVAARLQSQF